MHDELIVGETPSREEAEGHQQMLCLIVGTLIVRTYMYIFHKEIKQEAHRP